jgi:hypothetical protein
MCFDYEKFREENRENLKEGSAIRAREGIFLEEQKCSLQRVFVDLKFSRQNLLPDFVITFTFHCDLFNIPTGKKQIKSLFKKTQKLEQKRIWTLNDNLSYPTLNYW